MQPGGGRAGRAPLPRAPGRFVGRGPLRRPPGLIAPPVAGSVSVRCGRVRRPPRPGERRNARFPCRGGVLAGTAWPGLPPGSGAASRDRRTTVSDPVRRAAGPVYASYHQFFIGEEEEADLGPAVEDSHNGLVAVLPAPGRAVVHAGIHTGDVHVTVTVHRAAPAPDPGPWEEIAEVSLRSPDGDLRVRGFFADLPEDLPALSGGGPGDYRVRVHARGRDTAPDDAPEEITEWYLVQAWPAEPAPPLLLASCDRCGSALREDR